MTTLNIEELASSLGLDPNPTTEEEAGKPLVEDHLRSSTLKVDPEYQRLVSEIALEKYGPLKRDRLVSTLISRRPESCDDFAGDYIIDGQHKSIIHYLSGTETDDPVTWLPCQIKIWDEGMSLADIRKGEAHLFRDNNFYRKKPTKVDLYRAGVMFGDEESIRIQSHLIDLNLVIDNFGSDDYDALEVITPNPLFYTILQDLSDNEGIAFNQAQSALTLYKKIYQPTKIQGQVFRTMVLLKDFMDNGLSNSKQKAFKKWVIDQEAGLKLSFNERDLVRGRATFTGPRYILHDHIIDAYNKYCKNLIDHSESLTIGKTILKQAILINVKFAYPE